MANFYFWTVAKSLLFISCLVCLKRFFSSSIIPNSYIMRCEKWNSFVDQYQMPALQSFFEPRSLLSDTKAPIRSYFCNKYTNVSRVLSNHAELRNQLSPFTCFKCVGFWSSWKYAVHHFSKHIQFFKFKQSSCFILSM